MPPGTIREDTIRAGAGNRTPDLLLTMEALCRLSYSGGREMITTPERAPADLRR